MIPSIQQFEKQKGVVMGRGLRHIYRKLVLSGKMTVEKFWETAQANNTTINKIISGV